MSLFRRDPADREGRRSRPRTAAPSAGQVRGGPTRRRFRSAERRDEHPEHAASSAGFRKTRAELARDDRLSAHEAEVQRRAAAADGPDVDRDGASEAGDGR